MEGDNSWKFVQCPYRFSRHRFWSRIARVARIFAFNSRKFVQFVQFVTKKRRQLNSHQCTMILLEVIATSVEDCSVAAAAGADRIELNSAFALGGLTPSLGLLIEARRATRLPLMVMLRPRSGGFCYTGTEFKTLLRDAELALANGADGLVFGCLHADGTVDAGRTAALVQLAGRAETVFHRAFDVTPDPLAALDRLIGVGVTRVLTSGQCATVVEGAANVAAYIRHAAGRIQLLPGSGVNLATAAGVIHSTGATQVHASLSGARYDRSTAARPAIRFGAAGGPPEDHVRILDPAMVAAMRALLDRLKEPIDEDGGSHGHP
jgi:copper homeostasis protein